MPVSTMRLLVHAAAVTAVLAIVKGGKGGPVKSVPVLERKDVKTFVGSDITLDSCTFVKALGALKGNVTLYMMGDSTMFHQAKGACMVATKHFHTPDGPWSQPDFGVLMEVPRTMNLMTEKLTFEEDAHFSCEIPLPDQGKLIVAYYAVGRPSHDFDGLKKMQKVFGLTPDIFYFNAGLHYMHMEPSLGWTPASIDAFRDLEKDMPKFLSQPLVKETPTVVYFKTHAVCDERYVDDFEKILGGLKENPQETAETCVSHVHEVSPERDPTPQACMDSFIVRSNVVKFNDRAVGAINAAGQNVKFVDGFGITDADKCEHTRPSDGRHYLQLVPTELAELLKQAGYAGSVDAEYTQKVGC